MVPAPFSKFATCRRGGGDPAPFAKAVAFEMPCRRSPLPGADAEFNN